MKPPLLRLYPKLGDLAMSASFMAAVADDHWLDSVGPWLRIPDLVSGSGPIWEKLKKSIPEFTPFDLPNSGGESGEFRVHARRIAIVSIAVASGLGLASYTHHFMLGGDANIKTVLSNGSECRIGLLKDVTWRPSPSLIAKAVSLLSNRGALETLEVSIFPLLGAAADDYEKQFSRWKVLEPIRQWDATHRSPIVLRRSSLPAAPFGYTRRYDEADLAVTGIPYKVANKIAAPFASAIISDIRASLNSESPPASDLLIWAIARCS